MSNERTDEFLTWRGRLAPRDALPDQGLDDKEVSWERLAERLREKPRRRAGYWIAAACLLLALIPATHFFRDRPDRLVGRQPLSRPSALLRPSVQRPPATPTPHQPVTLAQQQPLTLTRPQSDRPAGETSRLIRPSIHTPSLIAAPAPDSILTVTLSLTSAPAHILAARPPEPRPPLKIAYLNEINNPGPSALLATRQPAFLRFGAAFAAEYSVNNNTAILNIELSSPNH